MEDAVSTFQVSTTILLSGIGLLAVLLIVLALLTRWLLEASGITSGRRIDRDIRQTLSHAQSEFRRTVSEETARVLELQQHVQNCIKSFSTVADRVRDLTPANIRQQIDGKIKFLAEQQSADAVAEKSIAKDQSKLARAWLRALAGGSLSEIAEVARLGYGDDFEEDLKGRLDVWMARQRIAVAGRDPTAAIRDLRPQARTSGPTQAPRRPSSDPSAGGRGLG
jgi:hypothetical protein